MKSYRSPKPRAAFGITAVVALLNFVVLVVLPSKIEADGDVFAMRVQASTAAAIRFVAPGLEFGWMKQKKQDVAPRKLS